MHSPVCYVIFLECGSYILCLITTIKLKTSLNWISHNFIQISVMCAFANQLTCALAGLVLSRWILSWYYLSEASRDQTGLVCWVLACVLNATKKLAWQFHDLSDWSFSCTIILFTGSPASQAAPAHVVSPLNSYFCDFKTYEVSCWLFYLTKILPTFSMLYIMYIIMYFCKIVMKSDVIGILGLCGMLSVCLEMLMLYISLIGNNMQMYIFLS